jgi:UDP-N-acetylmuramoyl-L-alanyl-D-glutamate--2,6-diaminopimelate ligase
VKAAAFTNLSHDHLDYHGTMDAYLAAKMRLFAEVVEQGGAAVVWADDAYSRAVIDVVTARGVRLMTVGTQGADLRLVTRDPTQLGQSLVVAAGGANHKVTLPLIGAYQAANALVAAGLVIATGSDIGQTLANLARLQPVRGRLERAAITRAGAPVYVDYAHTPDAVEAALDALRPHASGRLILVFGAGGDRDKDKRPEMGRVAAAKADVLIITDDNPRGEDPALIRAAIAEGAPGAEVIGDRRAAIAAAIAEARAEDIICIAGKGHEQGQIVGAGADMRAIPFDDVAVAREAAA